VNRLLGKILRVRTAQGISIRLVNPLEYHQRVLLFEAVYEPELTRFLVKILSPGMVLVDVGANLGYYTLLGGRQIGPRGQVHAFEPAPAQFRHLTTNVRMNRLTNVLLNECAVTDRVGETDLFLSRGWNQGTHSLRVTPNSGGSSKVKCTSLDAYVAEAGIGRIDVIKMDVEGGELLVCRGAGDTLKGIPPPVVTFEACEESARAFGYSTKDVKALLEGYGYKLFRIEVQGAPVPTDRCSVEEHSNLVGLHARAPGRYYDALRGGLGTVIDDD
jgi:FkbM family methyltransferase